MYCAVQPQLQFFVLNYIITHFQCIFDYFSVFRYKFNKSVFSFLRQLTTWHCPHSPAAAVARLLLTTDLRAVQQSVHISCPPCPQQQTRRSGMRRLDGTDGQTDGPTPVSCIGLDPAARRPTMRAMPKMRCLLYACLFVFLQTPFPVSNGYCSATDPLR